MAKIKNCYNQAPHPTGTPHGKAKKQTKKTGKTRGQHPQQATTRLQESDKTALERLT